MNTILTELYNFNATTLFSLQTTATRIGKTLITNTKFAITVKCKNYFQNSVVLHRFFHFFTKSSSVQAANY